VGFTGGVIMNNSYHACSRQTKKNPAVPKDQSNAAVDSILIYLAARRERMLEKTNVAAA
jgi:hypothetical protein